MGELRVLLVDDNADFVRGVSAWLAGEVGIRVVGTAGSGLEAIEQVGLLRPDLVLTDGTLPELDGFETSRRIKAEPGAPLVVLMAFHDSEAARNEAWAAGADGFIAKSAITGGLLALVRELVESHAARSKEPTKPGPSRGL